MIDVFFLNIVGKYIWFDLKFNNLKYENFYDVIFVLCCYCGDNCCNIYF